MTDEELERELRRLRRIQEIGNQWNLKIKELQQTIADEMAMLERRFDACVQGEIKIKESLLQAAKDHYLITREKEQKTTVGTLQLKINKDLIIDNDTELKAFIDSNGMRNQLIQEKFKLSPLKTWLCALVKVGAKIHGAKLIDKYGIAVIFPKE